jgi:hypothetical protein
VNPFQHSRKPRFIIFFRLQWDIYRSARLFRNINGFRAHCKDYNFSRDQ